MATDHTLNLKAKLDITELEQQLNQIRSQMTRFINNVTGGNKSANVQQTQASRSIDSSFKSLQSSIDRLNQSISRLTQTQSSMINRQSGSSEAPIMSPPPIMSPLGLGSYTQRAVDIRVREAMKKALLNPSRHSDIYAQQLGGFRGIFGGLKGSQAEQESFKRQFDGAITSDFIQLRGNRNKRVKLTPLGKQIFGEDNTSRNFVRSARFLAGSYALGGFGQALSNQGYETAGGVVSGLSEGISAGAMGAMALGGPAGWAIGIGTAVVSISQELLQGAQKIAKASEEAYATLQNGKKRIETHRENVGLMRWTEQITAATPEARQTELQAVKKQIEKAKQRYYQLADQGNSVQRSAAEKYLEDAAKTEAGSQERIAVEAKYGKAIVAYANSLDNAKKQLDTLTDKQRALEHLVDEDTRKSERDQEEKKREQERADRLRLAQDEQRFKLRDAAMDIITGLNRDAENNTIAQQLYDIQYDQSGLERKTSPLSQFKQASELLDKYRAQRQNALRLARTQAQDVRDLDLSNEDRASILEMSKGNIENAQHLAGVIGQIESFISKINTQPNWKPNMDNVTSLGQYGFNMGERNDNIDRLDRYYRNMEDLTTQIRNKLQEGIRTESNYN